MPVESNEVRFAKLEMQMETSNERIERFNNRVDRLEQADQEQLTILTKLGHTVETLAQTVATLNVLTRELDKGQEIFKARFNIIIGILSAIGVTVMAGVVKILFFAGGPP